jgi:L-fuculose-phosphate aldolase
MPYHHEREQIAYFMRRLYRQGLTTTSGGNLSCRTTAGHIAISASKSDKAELQAAQVAILGLDGTNLTPELTPTIEAEMHLRIYRRRPDVQAIVHAHPVTATTFCAATTPINTHLIAESYALLADPVFIPYACMGSDELAERVAASLGDSVCALLRNHGVLTIGDTLLAAFDRLELLEMAARQTLIAGHLDGIRPLNAGQCAELDELMGRKPKIDGANRRDEE